MLPFTRYLASDRQLSHCSLDVRPARERARHRAGSGDFFTGVFRRFSAPAEQFLDAQPGQKDEEGTQEQRSPTGAVDDASLKHNLSGMGQN